MSETELLEDIEVTKNCYKYNERLYGNLNVVYNEENSIVIFWNKYQIFLHEELNFSDAARKFVPEFQIQQLIVSNNYLVCLDYAGNVHTTSLKFKHSGQKKFKSSFQPREQGILHTIKYSSDTSLNLKSESSTHFLCLHKINAEYQLERKVALTVENEDWPLLTNRGKTILNCHTITKEEFELMKDFFSLEDNVFKNHSVVLISFDKLTVYACLFSQRSTDDVIKLIKFYISPTEICDILFNEENGLNALVALTTGTLVRLPLNNLKTSTKAEAFHLNTALAKITSVKREDTFIYTDGKSMWMSENTHSKDNIKFKQFFIKDVKDFIKYGDQLICTTYTNLIYMFCLENQDTYIKFDESEYCAAEKLLNNAELIYRITEEVHKCHDVVKKTNDEANFISAVSLSKRQDVVDNIVDQQVHIYESYEEIMKENLQITLTEDLHKYFEPETILFLVKISITDRQSEVNSRVLNLLQDLTIHVTLLTENKVIKTSSVKVKEFLKKINILIPLNIKEIPQVTVQIKFVREIPGSLDENKKMWPILSSKQFEFNSEHFIKTKTASTKVHNLRETDYLIEDLILKTAIKQHGELFSIKGTTNLLEKNSLSFYVKLPDNFKEIFKKEKLFQQHFNQAKSLALHKLFANEEFLKSKSSVNLEIGTKRIKIDILSDEFCHPLLRVTGNDMKIAFDIRNFFANLLYDDFKKYVPGKEFIGNALYTTTENIQKALKNCVINEEILKLTEQFHKNVIGSLPL